MATELSEAWSSLRSGQYDQAQRAFQQAARGESNQAYAFLGLAAASLATGNLRDALSFGEKSIQESHTPEAHLLLAEIHSRLGERRQAEEQIEDYFSSGGDAPYALALRGEQRIRTARWDAGITDYLNALEKDREGRAWEQLQRVLADLVSAVNHGNLPKEPAQQFLNQMDYKLANPPQGAKQYFASVRRALDSGSSLSGPEGRDPIFELLDEFDVPTGGASAGPPGTDSPPEPPSGPPTEPPGEPASNSSRANSTDETSDDEAGIDPKQKDLAGVIQSDRDKNEQLQDAIGDMEPPDWPSSPEYGEIDPIASLAWENQSIYAGEPGMDATDFRITSGSVRAEIFLERCLQNLLAGAKQERAVSVRFRPEAITRIEVNCWDGLLERLPPISPIYDEFHEEGKYEQLALGRFIGECVAVPYDGTWDFAEPPEDSRLIIGNRTLDPLGLAGRWVAASNPDEVDLESIADQAATASEDSTSLTVEQNYIDPTREVEGQSLSVKLAEMWSRYLFRLADASFSKLAETVDPLEVVDDAIVFEMAAEDCPAPARGPNDTALSDDNRVPLAYLRDRGEFLLMASRKHAARAAQAVFGSIDSENAADIITFLADHHRPGWMWVRNSDLADRLQSRAGRELDAPQLQRTTAGPMLEVDAVSDQHGAVSMQLVDPSDAERWRLELRT